jgi:hypothetical protein
MYKKVKKILKYYLFGESLKEMEIDRILDKVSDKLKLTDREKEFLDLYQVTKEEDLKDFLYLSKNAAFRKILDILENNKKIICDLHDRNGKIGLQIIKIENDFLDDKCLITMKGNETHELFDKFLYNIIYSIKKDEYSLQEQGEYFEKIPTKDED